MIMALHGLFSYLFFTMLVSKHLFIQKHMSLAHDRFSKFKFQLLWLRYHDPNYLFSIGSIAFLFFEIFFKSYTFFVRLIL